MKILVLTPYVTINGRSEFSRNKTGFGYMVFDIARAIAKTKHVDVLASDSRGNEFEIDKVRFLKRSFGLFLINVFRCLSPMSVWRIRKQYPMSSSSLIRLLYYWFISGYYCYVIKKGNYDIIHIHGCGFATELWMQICMKCNQKYIVTLHGLNSFSDSVIDEPGAKQYERDFLQKVVDGEFPITVISTGIKRMIEKEYGVNNCDNVLVVCNSVNLFSDVNYTYSIREKYGIPSDAKVLLYVGNISENKNQLQMVEAFELLPKAFQEQTFVLFCGLNHDKTNAVDKAIKNSSFTSHLILCGGVDKKNMSAYYQSANAVVLLSKAEGFGLSLIEGMHFGLPCLMFTDMDAFEDIYDENSVIGVKDRSNQSVADGIERLLTKQWDVNVIKSFSEKFEDDIMAKNYISVFNSK